MSVHITTPEYQAWCRNTRFYSDDNGDFSRDYKVTLCGAEGEVGGLDVSLHGREPDCEACILLRFYDGYYDPHS